jgi:ATP-dependent DNA helicase Q1
MFEKGDAQRQRSCAICDNCTEHRQDLLMDARMQMYQLLVILAEMCRQGGRITLTSLSDVARGLGGGKFNLDPNLSDARGGSSKASASKSTKAGVVDVAAVAGGKITLHRDMVDRLIVHGILSQLIEQSYQATAYTVNVYLEIGPKATRFLRHPLESVSSPSKLDLLPPVQVLPPNANTASQAPSAQTTGKRSGIQADLEPESSSENARPKKSRSAANPSVNGASGNRGTGAKSRPNGSQIDTLAGQQSREQALVGGTSEHEAIVID